MVLKLKAMILNSGLGKRLLPLTKFTPKALIEVDGKAVLGFQLDCLLKCGIKNLIITTGPFENIIKGYVGKEYPELDVIYVKNPKYQTTNYIYSMWLARKFIDDNMILIHGDLLFDNILLERMINDKSPDCVLVNKKIKAPGKDFKAVVQNNKVVKISVESSGENAFFCAPLYKFSKHSFILWLSEIERFVKQKDLKVYAENAFNSISDKITLYPFYFTDEKCLEIDTLEDLNLAKTIFSK